MLKIKLKIKFIFKEAKISKGRLQKNRKKPFDYHKFLTNFLVFLRAAHHVNRVSRFKKPRNRAEAILRVLGWTRYRLIQTIKLNPPFLVKCRTPPGHLSYIFLTFLTLTWPSRDLDLDLSSTTSGLLTPRGPMSITSPPSLLSFLWDEVLLFDLFPIYIIFKYLNSQNPNWERQK